MKSCPQCGAPMADDARFCTQCGYSFQAQPAQPQAPYRLPETKQIGSIWAVLGPVLAILIIGIGLLLVPRSVWDGQKKSKDQPQTEISVRTEALDMLNEALEAGEARLKEELAKGDYADPAKIKELEEAIAEVKKKIQENQ